MSLFRTGFQHSGLSAPRAGFSQQLRSYYGKRVVPRAFQAKPAPSFVRTQARAAPRLGLLLGGSLVAAGGLSLYSKPVACESARPYATSSPAASPAVGAAAEPESMVNVYELTFGTLCGVCAGVFIKKGAKALAFLLGGAYVLLQYLNSQRLVNVNWGAIGKRYDGLLGKATDGQGGNAAKRVWMRLTDFLTADFQPRATFMAGLVLGLRLG